MRPRLPQGLIQIYTGNSKGKSTAAFGLALRALGHGFKVSIIQFMKGSDYYGELKAFEKFAPQLEVQGFGRSCPISAEISQGELQCDGCGQCFIHKGEATAADRASARSALEQAQRVIDSGEYDLVILDELNNALYFDLLNITEVVQVLKGKPPFVEIVITGRNAPDELIALADLVTNMQQIKHPFEQGIASRRGIEY